MPGTRAALTARPLYCTFRDSRTMRFNRRCFARIDLLSVSSAANTAIPAAAIDCFVMALRSPITHVNTWLRCQLCLVFVLFRWILCFQFGCMFQVATIGVFYSLLARVRHPLNHYRASVLQTSPDAIHDLLPFPLGQ